MPTILDDVIMRFEETRHLGRETSNSAMHDAIEEYRRIARHRKAAIDTMKTPKTSRASSENKGINYARSQAPEVE